MTDEEVNYASHIAKNMLGVKDNLVKIYILFFVSFVLKKAE